MIKTRTITAQSLRLAFTAILGLSAMNASAAPGGQEANASVITFSPAEGLKASNASSILSNRLDLRQGTDELRSAYVEHPGGGLEIQRFNQYFKGIRMAHASYTLTSKDGIAAYAVGKFFRLDPGTSITPQLSEAAALDKALKATNAGKYMWEVDKTISVPTGELQFSEDFTNGEADNNPRLAYVFDIYAAEPLSREKVYVDAATGKILLRDAIMKHVGATGSSLYSDTVGFEATLVNSNYILRDQTRGNGIVTFDLKNGTNPSASTTDTVSSTSALFARDPAVDAHWGATQVYDYWKLVRNRNSWDGNNGILRSYVHYGTAYNNAFWSGSAMFYGDGSGVSGGGLSPLTTLDVCAHEIGHGICQSTAGLVYQGESGGMNEAFSDIWGAVVEAYANPNEVDAIAKDKWLIGEELTNTFRSMRDPKTFRQPTTYLGAYWIFTGPGCSTSNDNCGVHTNSGVLNYWFYLLSEGGKGTNDLGNPYHVQKIGMSKAAAIAYATELTLTSSSNYAACRAASIAAATTLYGACSQEVEAVTRAWYAVNVGANYAACVPQVSFNATTTTYDENVANNVCIPSRSINLPVVLNGPAPTGGNATVTVIPFGGTAISGVDYAIANTAVTFTTGSTAPQNIAITVYDNGSLGQNKYIDLAISLAANGSNVSLPGVLDTIRVTISNDDKAPQLGNVEYHTAGASQIAANTSSPFLSGYANGRGQYIYSAAELSAGGLKPGVPITAASFNVSQKFSTAPFTGYTVKMGHVNPINFTSGFLNSTSFTTVHSSNYTTSIGWNAIPFSTNFLWDGVSGIAVEVCFSNTSADAGNDRVMASASGSAAATAFSNSVSGCGLSLSNSNISYYRPVLRFTQTVPPADIATKVGDTRTWNVKTGQTVYYYTEPGKKAIAGVLKTNKDLECVTATVTVAGNGFAPASGGRVRSLKEFELTGGTGSNDTFDVILYLTSDELGGMNPDNLYMVQTTSINDQNLQPTNTNIVIPNEIIYGQNWVGFRGTFNGMKRFYLTDGQLALSTGTVKAANDALWTGANPFQTSPVLHWNLNKAEHASIRLTDVTGKVVFSAERTLEAGVHSFEVPATSNYAPGTYILQVVRPNEVFTRQLVKQ